LTSPVQTSERSTGIALPAEQESAKRIPDRDNHAYPADRKSAKRIPDRDNP
jgi:hypothetical protein